MYNYMYLYIICICRKISSSKAGKRSLCSKKIYIWGYTKYDFKMLKCSATKC